MANQKKNTKADRAASGAKKKKSNGKVYYKQTEIEQKKQVPVRLIVCLAAFSFFLLFLITLLNPKGLIVEWLYKAVLGLFGEIVFYVSIPAFLYLFFIHAFSGKRPVLMRSICLGCFVMICGIFHGVVSLSGTDHKTFLSFGEMLSGSAGLISTLQASALRWLFGPWIPYIILTVAGILVALGAVQITVPSLIRAFHNRPKADWEEENVEELEEESEPAALVVNHLSNKRIEHIEKRRARQEEQAEKRRIEYERQEEALRQQRLAELEAKERAEKEDPVNDLMRQIDMDVNTPVSASEKRVSEPADDSIFTPVGDAPRKKKLTENIPVNMPVLDMEDIAADVGATVEMMRQEEELTKEVVSEPVRQPVIQPEKPVPAEPKVTAKEAAESAAQVAAEISQNELIEKPVYNFPPIDLLKLPVGGATDGTAEMRENTRRLNETLASFKIDAHIMNVTRGPSVTRYEVELDKGVRLNKLTTVADDIALSLGASGVRIAAVPGKISIVGIEVPNRAVTMVSLREVIDSPEFNKAKSKSSFAVGKDIGGSCIVGNIAKLPHMLIAGTTGSGKSVCMNSIIISLLYKASPEDVKLIMIDPKMVELGIYNSIPHLLIPVVTDPKKAAGSLQWAVSEMMRRYKSMSDAGVRDLESYNSIMEAEGGNKLPQVVVIIDELADLMIVAAKEVEESICRIAQMGRAAGIHLVIATQRPSADVITGLMKANIPSRIAFSVASAMESRIILDTMGAEKLVGKGDMLFSPIGSGKPQRVQGCFVSDSEVEAVATYVKDNYNVSYDKGIMEEIDKKAAQTGSGKPASVSDPEPNEAEMDGDEMLPAAVDVILETGQASVSMLQRRLKLGYARAARIVDEMEEKGIVGPFQGSKPRSILVTKEQWEDMKAGQPKQMGFDDLDDDFSAVPEELN